MLTYSLEKRPGVPLYESLYRCIRQDILEGRLQPGEKLPSKRALASHLELGKITVEAAYAQLLSEGYIRSKEKVGYFVEQVERPAAPAQCPPAPPAAQRQEYLLDLTANGTGHFPFSVWSRLQREVILDLGRNLLQPLPACGVWELRSAIASYLAAFRGMAVDPGCILVGAGTDFLYNLLIQLLGRDKVYAVEEPGYGKIRQVYAAGGVRCVSALLDSRGVDPKRLGEAQVLHISPNHHFPTGLVTPLSRRQELLDWAGQENWIIEDDYDSEFRFASHPLPPLQSLGSERVIYINSFTKSLAPSIRISYMVLPPALMEKFHRELGFYSCTVPSFEQYTLARFIRGGHFEKHINRMRRYYQRQRNQVIRALSTSAAASRLNILEQDAGLHFLVRVNTDWTDEALTDWLERIGIRVHALSRFYHDPPARALHQLLINYSAITPEQLPPALHALETALMELETDEKYKGTII